MITRRVQLAFFAVVLLAAPACVLEEKVLDIVVTGETAAVFSQDVVDSVWASGAIVDVGEGIRDILHDTGYTDGDLKSAHMVSLRYGVTAFSHTHDWVISGTISVSRNGGPPVVAMRYTSQSVQAALNQKITADLEEAGVAVINGALEDFVNGQNSRLTFIIDNATTTPVPSEDDRLVFDWSAWLAVQIVLDPTVEVPDPF